MVGPEDTADVPDGKRQVPGEEHLQVEGLVQVIVLVYLAGNGKADKERQDKPMEDRSIGFQEVRIILQVR